MPYTTEAELAAILKVDETANADTLTRVLTAAQEEIDAELGLAEPYDEDAVPALVAEVNLERAVEHWRAMKAPFGIIGLDNELGGTRTAKDSWERHAFKLAPLKETWGLA